MPEKSLYQIALGSDFDLLPATTRKIHCPDPVHVLVGGSTTRSAESWVGRLVARMFGMPSGDEQVSIKVIIERLADGTERWSRIYPTHTMRSVFRKPDPDTRSVLEIFGPFRFRTRILPNPTGLSLVLDRAWIGGLPLPRAVMPRADAVETADGDAHCFDVTVTLPLIGRLCHYHGRLEFVDPVQNVMALE